MKNKSIIIIVILLLCAVAFLIFGNNKGISKNTNKNTKTPTELKTQVEKINKKVIDGMTNKDYEAEIGKKLPSAEILTGKDTFLREELSEEYTSEIPNVDLYNAKRDEYASRVEAKIKENFSSEVLNEFVSGDGDSVVELKYKVYYYELYLYDLEVLTNQLIEYAGYNINELNYNDQTLMKKLGVDNYKAKIKGMEIMDNYLDNYVNKNEYFETQIISYENEAKSNASLEGYLLTVSGCMSKTYDLGSEKGINERREIVKSYIDSAITNKTLDKSNPLELK